MEKPNLLNGHYITSWKSNTIYVDIDTGEIIRPYKIKKQQYIIIKTSKNVTTNEHKTRGHITYTKQCRRNPQRKINFT